MGKKIGIIFADNGEFLPFKNYVNNFGIKSIPTRCYEAISVSLPSHNKDMHSIVAVLCGIGKVNAATAAAFLIAEFGVDLILNAGFSGAVSAVHRGDILAGTTYVECDFDLTELGYAPGEKAEQNTYIYDADPQLLSLALALNSVNPGKLGTGDFFLTNKDKKEEYKQQFHIHAFDMESAAIASVCYKAQIPFLSLRKISDDADDSAIEAYREMNENQDISLSELLIAIIKKL